MSHQTAPASPPDCAAVSPSGRNHHQGIAKLPFIDEGRLLHEIRKVEHTLTEEEARRNSTMFDMLFVTCSHPLSPYIFSLDDRCKQLSDRERIEIKEKIDPKASGGMNGYLSLCSGDPCPPFFRSPVEGMEDIMNNQAICAIYRLPDVHKHVTKPPTGVVLPPKTVTVGDLKPPPALWHEDNGRKPWVDRQNQSGNGRQLGDAAHRLVANSLQMKNEHGGGNQVHQPPASYGRYNQRPEYGDYPSHNDRFAHANSRGHSEHQQSYPHNHYSHGRPYNPQYERNNWQAAHPRDPHMHHGPPLPIAENSYHGYPIQHVAPPGTVENGQHRYPQHGAYVPPRVGGYNDYGSHQAYGANSSGQHWRNNQGPPAHNSSYGRGNSQGSGNRYNNLDRSRRPPAPHGGYNR